MAGSWRKEIGFNWGAISYSPNGKLVRVKGRPGFERANSQFVKNYIRMLQKRTKDVIIHQLPQTVRSFIDTALTTKNVPRYSNNLRDSIVGAVAYKDGSGEFVLVGGRAIYGPKLARVPQTWGLDLGGSDTHLRVNKNGGAEYYKGYGRDYLENYAQRLRDPEEEGIVALGDVVVILEATIPYALTLNDEPDFGRGGNKHVGWFNDLSDMFKQKIAMEVNVVVNDVSTDIGIGELGISTQIGYNR